MREIANFDEMRAMVGEEMGISSWVDVTQDRIDKFAEATGDFQWIHVDPARAKDELPGGKTIAHGYLTLSLVPMMMYEIYKIANITHGLNYGANKIRFTSPVPSGSRVRGRLRIKDTEDMPNNGLKIFGEVTIEIEGAERPACVAETISVAYSAV
ncbi:MAG: MaoC family dehydratase [Alphaproteobacteria bacterium]|nr:MaoC family dehydratase [Alphaproteobacteria bacterium]